MKTYKEFLESMHRLRELSDRVYPDSFRLVCLQDGIKETVAMDMYAYFKIIVRGRIPYRDGKPLGDEQVAKILDLAERADGLYAECGSRIRTVILGRRRWEDSLDSVLVVWRPKDDGERQYSEFDLTDQETYVTVGKMIENGCTVEAVIRQSDRIDSTNRCMSLDEGQRGARPFKVYDGDVILAYVDRPAFWSSDARNCGLYLCSGGAYRRLLYTPGKGYVRKGKPDEDEDFKLDVAEGAFNSHVLTMSQKWERIGNVHVDVGFLVETIENNSGNR